MMMKTNFNENKYIIMMILVGSITASVAILASHTWLVEHYELKTLDYFYRHKISKVDISDNIVLVIIDDYTVKTLGWPLPRNYYAAIIDLLEAYKVKAIVFDIAFVDPGYFPDENRYLADETKKNPNIIHSAIFGDEVSSNSKDQLSIGKFSLPEAITEDDFPSAKSVMTPIPEIMESTQNLADVSISPDDDGIIRKLWVIRKYEDKIYPSLGLASACLFLNLKKEDISVIHGREVFLQNKYGLKIRIPIDSSGRMSINFANPDSFNEVEYSFYWLLQKFQQISEGIVPKDMPDLENKLVFIGRYITGDTDQKPTPYAAYVPMIRVHANVASNIIQQSFIQQVPVYQGPVLTILFGLLMAMVTYLYRPLFSAIVFSFVTISYTFLSYILFVYYSSLIAFLQPLLASLLSFSFSTFHRYIYEKKRMIKYNESIMESMGDGLIVVDHAGYITKFNKRAEEIFKINDAKGKSFREILSEDYKQVMDLILSTLNNRNSIFNKEIQLGNDNKRVYLEINTSIFQDEAAKGIGAIIVVRDASEIRILQKQIQMKERLSAIGELATEISHEIKNSLQGIKLYAENLIEELEEEDPRRDYVDGIIVEAADLSGELRQLNEYAKPATPKFTIINFNEVVENDLGKLFYVFDTQKIKVTRNFQGILPMIPIDIDFIQHILGNLFTNAVHAMSNGGELIVETWQKDGYIELLVKDTGTGIPEEIRDRIFDPYFTTKKGTGTGLGLSIAHKYIEAHKGTIQLLETKMGKGSTFIVRLPIRGGTNEQGFSS